MIDLKAARSDADRWRAALARKDAADAFDALLGADERWRALIPQVDELRTRTNLKGKPTPDELEQVKAAKEDLRRLESELAHAESERDRLGLLVPNPPHDSVPEGATEDDALEIRRVGEAPSLGDAKEHTEIGRFDMDRAARIAGSRFGYWIGDAALLALAMYRLALDRLVAKGFVPVLPPVLVREEALVGTGWLPSDDPNVYAVAGEDLYLAGTAEIPVGGLHLGELLQADDLPLRYVGFSPCFRSEAGAAGRDTRGMFRVHQFNKVEQFAFTRPDESWDEHERLLANTEEIVGELGVPYRVVVLPTGDMSKASAKTYDVEIWFPSQDRYRETASISNTTDFQARRLGTRFRGEHGPEPVHTLNGTAVVDRMALADPRELPRRRPGRAAELRRTRRDPLLGVRLGHNAPRWGAGAVERGGLENRWACKRLVGSNPTPTATSRSLGAGSVRRAYAGQRGDGEHDQPHVLAQRPVRHVQVVELRHLVERDVARSQHLPQTGHARLQVEASSRPGFDVLILVEDEWPGADDRHLAADDIDQLRQLVDAPATQKATDTRDSRVVGDLEHPRVFVAMHVHVRDFGLSRLGIVHHRPELEDVERSSLAPMRTCRKKIGPRESITIEIDAMRRSGERRTRPAAAPRKSKARLRNRSEPESCGIGQPDQGDAFDRVQLCVRAQHLEHARNDVDLNVAVLHRANHRERLLVRVRRERDCDSVHRVRLHERGQVSRSIRGDRVAGPRSAKRRPSRSTKPTIFSPYSGWFPILFASRRAT